MQKLNSRKAQRTLRQMQTIKLLNRINTYYETLDIIKEAHTIKQIENKIKERIDSTQKYISELNKDFNEHEN